MRDNAETLKKQKEELIERARQVLLGNPDDDVKGLLKGLVKRDLFSYAAEIQKQIINNYKGAVPLEDYQALAKFIYKDHSLPSSFKFDRALKLLEDNCHLATTINPETLGLAGAIYKRKWLFDHQVQNLEQAKFFYGKGYESWKIYCTNPTAKDKQLNDDGYTAINYAYVLELLAVEKLELCKNVTGVDEDVYTLLSKAKEVRLYIIATLTDGMVPPNALNTKSNWILPTITEAYFGLREYDNAQRFIEEYLNRDADAWEVRSFSQQLFASACLQFSEKKFDGNKVKAGDVVQREFKPVAETVDLFKIDDCLRLVRGENPRHPSDTSPPVITKYAKTGLSLSGGGFRASLFHIGVLAALAEADELKNIEVLSCVSGGSIIGAFYYLKLRRLLQGKEDSAIVRADYIQLIREVEEEFLIGIQENLRMRVFRNLYCNVKMLFSKNYSRTTRLGELYEEHLYKNIFKNDTGDIYMNDLYINPPGEFYFETDNWKRKNRIPQLVLNATSVNTGHNWQFTASWMGEPPDLMMEDIDVKPRLRRMYYGEAPPGYRKFPLGAAVGASSCVPVLFEPLPMYDLYEGIDLQLIDGGLHDNQGIGALIDQECANVIISDASGQMPTSNGSVDDEISVFYRSDSILQERLRELQFMDLLERRNAKQISVLKMMHLKKGLHKPPVSWIDCKDPVRKITSQTDKTTPICTTPYGIAKDIQAQLAELRTDLDSFSDTEAYALMYSGYAQTKCEYDDKAPFASSARAPWKFLEMEKYLNEESAQYLSPLQQINRQQVITRLKVGRNVFFKLIMLNFWLKSILIIVGILALGWLVCMIYASKNKTLLNITVQQLASFGVLVVVIMFLSYIMSLFNYKVEIKKKAMLLGLIVIGFVASNIYIKPLNWLYNKLGRFK